MTSGEREDKALAEKDQHLRRHCVVCTVLFESREELLIHMKESHPTEVTGAVFWSLQKGTARSEEEDEGLSEDERAMIEYGREHPGEF